MNPVFAGFVVNRLTSLFMSKTKNALIGAIIVVLGFLAAVSLMAQRANAASLTPAQTQAIVALLQSFGADSATIESVKGALEGTAVPSIPSPSLKFGDRGPFVVALQKELISQGYKIPAGATGYYGAQTRAAVNARAADRATSVPTPSVPTSGDLTISVASGSSVLVQGQALATLGTFTFVNPSSSDVKVTSLNFKRIGVSNDSSLANVYLYNGAKRLTDSAGVSNSVFNFNDPNGVVVVGAKSSISISVKADIANGTSGQQVGVSLTSLSSNGTVGTSLPLSSGYLSISAASLATADFGSTLPSSTSVNAQNDYVLWQNTVNVGTRSVNLNSLQLRNVGSVKSTDIVNLRLYVDGVFVSSASLVDNIVTFDLSANPKKLETGGRVIKVVGDIVGGSSSTFQFSLRRASDAQMIDTDLGQPILATANGSNFSARSAASATISSGSVSVVKANNSPSSDAPINSTNVKLATFELRASGEDVKVTSLDVKAVTSGSKGLQNGKVFLNGGQIGSAKNLPSGSTVSFDLSSSLTLKAGAVVTVDVYADTKAVSGTLVSGDSAVVSLVAGSSNGQGVISFVSLNVPSSEVSGSSIVLSSSSVSLSKASGYGDHTFVPGANNVKVGSFVLSAGSTEGINVNTLTLTLSSGEADMVTDLRLSSAGPIGNTKPTVSTSNSFSVNIDLPASATKVVDVFANIKPTATGSWAANVDGFGTGSLTGNSVSFIGATQLQNITVGTGALTSSVSGSTPDNAIALAGSLVKVGSFNFTAQYSSYTIDKILVKIPANAATSVESVTLKYPTEASEASSTGSLAFSSGSYATSTFTGLSFYVPAGETKKLDVYVKLNSIQQDGDSGKEVYVALDANEGYRAVDSSGTAVNTLSASDLVSAASGKGSVFVRKAVPTISKVALDSSVLSAGTNRSLAKVKVSGSDISWNKIVFSLGKSSSVVLSDFALYSGSAAIGGTFATTSDTISFVPSSEQQVSGDATYELRASVSGIASGYNYVDVSISNPSASSLTGTSAGISATSASLVWSDRSSVANVHSTSTSDWANDHLVKNLILNLSTLSVNI